MLKNTKHAIIISDVVTMLKKIPNNSVQLIIADPPYNINIAKWDSYENYREWAAVWIDECFRVLSHTGNIVIFGGFQFDNSGRGDLLELLHYIRHNTRFRLVNVIIWYYKNGISARRFFSNRHEEIVWFSKSAKYTFNLDSVRVKYDEQTLKIYKKDKRLNPLNLEKGKNPTNVWEISRLNSNSRERVGHPTQKPEAVIKRIVHSMSNEGDIVLDLFSGSAITLKVCSTSFRHSINCDIDSTTMDFAKKQLKMINMDHIDIHTEINTFFNKEM